MSSLSCWRCGLLGHHRRDCTLEAESGSASSAKRESHKDHKFHTKKTQSERIRNVQLLGIKFSPMVSRRLLRQHLELSSQFLLEFQYRLEDIGEPRFDKLQVQAAKARSLKDTFEKKAVEIREVVGHAKNYLARTLKLDSEDVILKETVEGMADIRQSLFVRCSRLIADLAELIRQKPLTKTLITTLDTELSECEAVLNKPSPTMEEIEATQAKFRDLKVLFATLKTKMRIFENIIPEFSSTKVAELESRMQQLWEIQKNKLYDLFSNLENLAMCGICTSNPKNVALACGYCLCSACLIRIRAAPNWALRICPHCRGTLDGYRNLH